jgi:hypothetical protein
MTEWLGLVKYEKCRSKWRTIENIIKSICTLLYQYIYVCIWKWQEHTCMYFMKYVRYICTYTVKKWANEGHPSTHKSQFYNWLGLCLMLARRSPHALVWAKFKMVCNSELPSRDQCSLETVKYITHIQNCIKLKKNPNNNTQ